MRLLARFLLLVGVVGVVLSLSKLHAAYVAEPAYDYTGSFRFAWSFMLMGGHLLAAYSLGLPDLVRGRRGVLVASLVASVAATVAISVLQLVVGDALLPRFVVFGSGLLLTAWYGFCAQLSDSGRTFDAERDRVVVVGSWADAADLREELDNGAERQARIVDVLTVAEARSSGSSTRPADRSG